ncbi:hypothetical protein ACMG4P_05005 [Pseudovibrio denitrificans]|uniref:hypothetical protein n=1 Tax=Pseudovibrio denitrificans TaxID=258256 RepID=UPI0039BF59D3
MWFKAQGDVVTEVSYASEDANQGWQPTDQVVYPGDLVNGDGTFSRSQASSAWSRLSVAEEAEQRIEMGTQINGIQFRCDDKSLRRLNALLRGFDRDAIGLEGKTYETAAGVPITFTSKAEVEFVLNSAEDFELALLERSAEIQQLDLIPDPSQDLLWDLTKTLPEIIEELT